MQVQIHNKKTLENKKKHFDCLSFTVDQAGIPQVKDIPCFANQGTEIVYNKNTFFNLEKNNYITVKHLNQKFCVTKKESKMSFSIYEDECKTFNNPTVLSYTDNSNYLITKNK